MLDELITRVINRIREEAAPMRESVLGGELDREEYLRQTGRLTGLDWAVQIMIEEAKRLERDDD